MSRTTKQRRNKRRRNQQNENLTAPTKRLLGAPVVLPSDTRAVRAYLRLQAWNREANATNCRRNTKHGLRSRFLIGISDKQNAAPETSEKVITSDNEREAQFAFYKANAQGEVWEQRNN